MKRITRCALMLVISIAVLCFIQPTSVFAAETTTGKCGENATYSYDGMGTLTISGTGAISFSPCDEQTINENDVTSIVIESGITEIGLSVFASYRNLTDVNISDTVKTIGNYAFNHCDSLTEITIPNSVTVIGSNAFELCEKLTNVNLGSSVEEIGEFAFYQCFALENITIPEDLTTIGMYAFAECTSLKEIILPDSVATIGGCAFTKCTSLTKAATGNGIDAISGGLFEYCSSLTDITIGSNVTYINPFAFHACSSLRSISFPSGIFEINEAAFSRCYQLTRIDLPDALTTLGADAFSACLSLSEVSLPESLDSIGYDAFAGCPSLRSIYFKGNCPSTIKSGTFSKVTATAYYPCDNNTWAESSIQNFDGILTWVPINYSLNAPSINVSSRASDGKPVITWNAVDGAVKYQVYNSTDKVNWKRISTTTSTKVTNTSAVTGKYYSYYVVALDSDGNRSMSSNVAVRTCDLARPAVTIANNTSSGKPILTWDAVEGASKYQVYSASSKNGPYTRILTTTKTTATNTSAKAGKTYYYKVRAIHSKSAANSADSSVVYRTCDLPRPIVTVSNVASTGKIRLTWDAVDGAAKYQVYCSTSKNGPYTKLITTTNTTVTNTSAKSGQTYYYKVRAIHSKSAANSADSSVVYRTCDLPRPVVRVKLNTNGKPRLSWDAVDGAVKYHVYRSTDKNGIYSRIISTTNTTVTNTSAKSGTTYYYKVYAEASKSAANSAYSSVVSIRSK